MSGEEREATRWSGELEAEAAMLEETAREAPFELPEGFEGDRDAMLARIHAEADRRKKRGRSRLVRRIAAAAAAVLVVVCVWEFRTTGEKVYTQEAVRELKDGEVIVKINNDERIEKNVKEKDICREIGTRLGIQAVRLGYKPREMKLYRSEILESSGEARTDYLYKEHVITVYIDGNYSTAKGSVVSDGAGKLIESVEIFSLAQNTDIYEADRDGEETAYFTEFVYENTYYMIRGVVDETEFSKIVEEIYLESV